MLAQMQWSVMQPDTLIPFLVSVATWGLVGILILLAGFKIFDFCTPKIKFNKELTAPTANVAVAIVIAGFLIAVSIIVHAAISIHQ